MTNHIRKVLIVDDEAHIRKVIKKVVLSLGYEDIREAANGRQALKLFKQEHSDLVLLDINMPEKSGTETLQEIIKCAPQTCVVMITSVADPKTVKMCAEQGATNYILKSNSMAKITETLAQVIKNHEMSEPCI